MKMNWFADPANVPAEIKDNLARSLFRNNLQRLAIVAAVPALFEILMFWFTPASDPGRAVNLPVIIYSLLITALLLVTWTFNKALRTIYLRVASASLGFGILLTSIYASLTWNLQLGPASLYILTLVGLFSLSTQPLAEALAMTLPAFILFSAGLAQTCENPALFWGTLSIALAVNLFLLLLSQARMIALADDWANQVQLDELKTRLRELNQKDQATGLLNRATIRTRLTDEISRTKRFNNPLCVLMIDIDDLDFINKQLGTATGDKVIQMIAQTLARTLRTTDMIGRHGSDEFVIILPNTNLDNAKIAVRRIQDAIGAIDATQAGVKVTISGGLSQHHGEQAETLIIITDARLRQAKSQGKNQFVME